MAMIRGVKATCDVCKKEAFIEVDGDDPTEDWLFNTEIGDLCPCCKLQWIDWKETFVTKRRKDTKGDLR